MGKKTNIRRIRFDDDLLEEIDKYLEVHTIPDLSKLVRISIEEKMRKTAPIESEIDKLTKLVTTRFENLQSSFKETLQMIVDSPSPKKKKKGDVNDGIQKFME